MSQHDYVVDNASGAAVRSDINSALQAILTNNSGDENNLTTAAYMLWADTASSPNLLKIRDSSDGAWITICEIASSGTGTMTGGQSFFSNGTQNLPSITFKNDPDSGMRRTDANKVSIVTNGSDQLTVDENGKVGIKTDTPEADLHIASDGNAVAQLTASDSGQCTIRFGDTGDTNEGKIQYLNGDGTNGTRSLSFDTAASTRLTIDSSGNVGIAETTPTEVLHVNGNIKGTGNIFIGTTGTPHSQTGTVEKIRISQNELSVANDGGAGIKVNRLSSNGDAVKFFRSGVEVGSIELGTSTTSFETTSDHRLKENVVGLTDGITRVKQLQPKRFNFIVDAETTFDGFLAHEAQAVVPEAVSGTHNEVDENGDPVMQGIDQSKLVPLLTAALQEAIAKIETLETKVAALEAGS